MRPPFTRQVIAGPGLGTYAGARPPVITGTLVPQAGREGHGNRYERILVAIDHSRATERVLAAARDLARLSQGQVWVVHVREHQAGGRGGVMISETIDEAHQAADAAVAELVGAGIKAQADIRYALAGHAASEITDSASAHGAGVIVMGSRGRGDLAGMLLGSTAHKVIHLTERPVLVIR